jgi:putative transposase
MPCSTRSEQVASGVSSRMIFHLGALSRNTITSGETTGRSNAFWTFSARGSAWPPVENQSRRWGIVDSQSVKTTEMGGPRGFDAGKKVKGRKRHLLVDIMGLLVTVLVTSANVQDRDAFPSVLREAQSTAPRLENVLVDGAYTGEVIENARNDTGIAVTVVKRSDIRGFVVLPKRWIVERSFGWMNRDRRLSKDYERTIASSENWIRLSFISHMVRRLAA